MEKGKQEHQHAVARRVREEEQQCGEGIASGAPGLVVQGGLSGHCPAVQVN